MRRHPGVRYLEWIIRLRAGGLRVDLTNSGASMPLDRLRVNPREPVPAGLWGGDPVVRGLIAARYGVTEAEVLPTLGTSLAVFLAVAATAGRGDGVLVESPGYETLRAVPEALGAEVGTFPRRSERGYALEPDAVVERLRPGTRLVILSDGHNPSGAAADPDAVARLAGALEVRGAALLVDEVYRDFRPGPVGTARRLGPDVLVASSLTKVYGLGPLRAGWVLAAPERVDAMKRVLTLLEVEDPAPSVPWVRAGFRQAAEFREETLVSAERGLRAAEAWCATRVDVRFHRPAGGMCVWLGLPPGRSAMRLAETLHREDGVGIVPGTFFGDDGAIRVSVGAEEATVRLGLEAVARRLDETRDS